MKDSLPNMEEAVRQEREEALKALDAATPGPWSWEGLRSEAGVYYQHILAVGMDNPSRGAGICNTYYSDPLPLEWNSQLDILPATFGNKENAHLIANAPTWLRNALERERLLIEEREQDKAEIERLNRKDYDSLGRNLDALDKIAEQDMEIQRLKEGWEVIANIPMSTHPSEMRDYGKKMLKGETPYKL